MAYKEIPDITLKMIINTEIIKIGTKVYSSPNNEIVGTLDKDGAITFEIDNEIKTFPFPSGKSDNKNQYKWMEILANTRQRHL